MYLRRIGLKDRVLGYPLDSGGNILVDLVDPQETVGECDKSV